MFRLMRHVGSTIAMLLPSSLCFAFPPPINGGGFVVSTTTTLTTNSTIGSGYYEVNSGQTALVRLSSVSTFTCENKSVWEMNANIHYVSILDFSQGYIPLGYVNQSQVVADMSPGSKWELTVPLNVQGQVPIGTYSATSNTLMEEQSSGKSANASKQQDIIVRPFA